MTVVTKATKHKKDEHQPDVSTKKPAKPQEKDKPLRYGPMPTFPHQKVWSRCVLVFGLMVYIWYSSKDGKVTSLARQREVLQRRGHKFECDQKYLEEVKFFGGCVPEKCGRFVSDVLVTNHEAETLLRIAKTGIALGGSSGGASILDLHSGALSYKNVFINVYSLKEAKEAITDADLAVYNAVRAKIQHAIAEIFSLDESKLHLTSPTFFSKLTNDPPKTDHDEYWHVHVDKVTYEFFHYTSLLYLTDYGVDFTGGRLVFMEVGVEKPLNNVTVEPRKGRVAMFTSGAENPHFVELVDSGARYALTVSFTCDATRAIGNPRLKFED